MALMLRVVCFASLLVASAGARGAELSITRAMDVGGSIHTIVSSETKATALVFLGTECPIGNRYIPYLNSLREQLRPDHVEIFGVVSDSTVTRKAAAEWQKTYEIKFPVLFDSSGQLAR